ncbi:MAG: hypothetical protein HY912_08010 [Desulfomonile tiedjei]|uniref:Uncharacterized protein n=1 Tax=Desulfomonile tiedjei TaxID=2358 RepID=A0A9D6V0T0_9BACT|nr:hypothetical protein [Desulfomonile tiedjei]
MILKLIGMIVLGILSGLLSFYNKNYYVKIFNDILGKEDEPAAAARVGRGFMYGFLFPVYFVLLLCGLVALVIFLITAGIIAAIVFVLVWVTEKLLPNEWLGSILLGLFEKVGIRQKAPAAAPVAAPPSTPPAQTAGEQKTE